MCHATAKRETVAVATTSGPFLGGSLHRKRMTITITSPPLKPASSKTTVGAVAPFNVNITPPTGYSVRLNGISINATVLFTSTLTITDGATAIATYNFSAPAGGADAVLPVPGAGILGSAGATMNILTGNSGAASANVMNIDAEFVPTQPPRISISPDSPAILDSGLTVEWINDVVTLTERELGDWLPRTLFAIANVAIQVSVVDIAEPGPGQNVHPEQDAELLQQVRNQLGRN